MEKQEEGYWVNIGDGDVLHVTAINIPALLRKIDKHSEFSSSMINAIVCISRAFYLSEKWHEIMTGPKTYKP